MDFDDPALRYVPATGWRERLARRDDPRRARARRVALCVAIVLIHAALLHRLQQASVATAVSEARDRRVSVIWLDADPASPPPPSPRRPAMRATVVPRTDAEAPPLARRAAPPASTSSAAAPAARPRLFAPDGGLLLPDAVSQDLARTSQARGRFGFAVPGVLEARTQVARQPALDYEATRFEEVWVEEKDLLTEALEKAVEKTTVTVRIPLPRAPGSKAVCKFALLAAAGGCGFVNESDGYVVRLDDPATLDASENAQCQAWWDAMASATTETDWLAARERYEADCRRARARTVVR